MKLDRDRLTLLGVRTNDQDITTDALAKLDDLLNHWPHVRKNTRFSQQLSIQLMSTHIKGRVPHDTVQLKSKKSKVGQTILEYLEDKEISFVVIGHQGVSGEKIMQGQIVDFITR